VFRKKSFGRVTGLAKHALSMARQDIQKKKRAKVARQRKVALSNKKYWFNKGKRAGTKKGRGDALFEFRNNLEGDFRRRNVVVGGAPTVRMQGVGPTGTQTVTVFVS